MTRTVLECRKDRPSQHGSVSVEDALNQRVKTSLRGRLSMTGLTIGNETFEVKVEGEAAMPALLLTNALGTNLSMWDAQIPELTKRFRVIRYDPRGHGGSQADPSPTSIAALGGDALAILDALEIERAHVIGLSMGGAVAIWLLANAPGRIDRAILANTAPRMGSPEAWNRRITSVLSGDTEGNAAATIERWFSPGFAAREPERVQVIHDMLRNASSQGYVNACAALRDMDLRSALAMIGNEVLVISGRDDPSVPEQDAKALAAGIADARHVALAARHLSNIEARDDFNAAVIAFLTQPKRRAAKTPKSKSAAPTSSPMKRGGAGRRSNAARSPRKKTPVKRSTAAKPAGRAKAQKSQAHKRPAKQRSSTRRSEPKVTTKKVSTSTRKASPPRRKTPTSKARGAVAKTATKKVAKRTPKTSAAKATKKLPTARRKPAGKSRRPSGRRKP